MAERSRFERAALVHMDAAYRLAFWIVRSSTDAEDIVQDAFLRAFQSFEQFKGEDIRPWLLTIVRNVALVRLAHRRRSSNVVPLEEAFPRRSDDEPIEVAVASGEPDAEALLIARADASLVQAALARLPDSFREILVLRELEGLSYRQISDVLGIPAGTVMSRLSRARDELRKELVRSMPKGTCNAL